MDKDVLRIVRGNDFTTRMRITAVDAAGKEVEGFSLEDSTGVEVYYTVGSRKVAVDEWTASGSDITIDWSGLGLGGYGFEISGVLDGSAWRMAVRLLFRIVATNECANVPAGTLVDGVYVLDNWLYLLSGGDSGAKDAVQYVAQTLTDEQKAQARENIGAQKDMSAMSDAEKQQLLRTLETVSYLPQTVDGARQQQARENIGAAMIPFVFEPFVAPGLNDSDVDQYLAEGRALQLSVDGNLVDYSQWSGGFLVWVVDDIDTISPYTRTTRVYRLNVSDDVWSVSEADYPSTEAMQGVVKDVSANPTSTQINAKNNAMNSAGINLSPNSVTIYTPGGSVAMNSDGIDLIPQGNGSVTINGEEPLVKGDVFVSQIAQGTVVYAPTQSGVRVSAAVVSVAEPTADAAKKYIAPSWSAVKDALDGKQDVINDLAAIRSGAAAGATAVQPAALDAKADKVSVINHGTSDTTFAVNPNVLHVWGEVAALTLTLATPTDNAIVNEYMVQFESGATATTLSLPSTITWVSTPNIQASKTYQISIINGLGVIAEFGEGGA